MIASKLFHCINVPLLDCNKSAPVLSYPIPEGNFILDTDASGDGIGGVLSQIQDGEERVLAYASRKPARRNAIIA